MTNNGPHFSSHQFEDFLHKNAVKQVLTPPYYPQSNGATAQAVQIIKTKKLFWSNSRPMERQTTQECSAKSSGTLSGKKTLNVPITFEAELDASNANQIDEYREQAHKRRGIAWQFSVGDAAMVERGETIEWFRVNVGCCRVRHIFGMCTTMHITFVHT